MRHGGDIAAASRKFGIPASSRLDLSTGINPQSRPGAAALPAETGGGRTVVDDNAFAECDPDASPMQRPDPGNRVIVLKSFGKFFGLPGLRLGFAIGVPAPVARLAALLGDWPVSAPAIAIGRAARADRRWPDETGHARLAETLGAS